MVAAALIVAMTERQSLHAGLLLSFVLADVVCSLAIFLGETGSLRPGAFLVIAQLVPLAGWLVWTDRLAEPVRWCRIRMIR